MQRNLGNIVVSMLERSSVAQATGRRADRASPQAGLLPTFPLRKGGSMSQNDTDVVPALRGKPAK
jgi:hypothetical protein